MSFPYGTTLSSWSKDVLDTVYGGPRHKHNNWKLVNHTTVFKDLPLF